MTEAASNDIVIDPSLDLSELFHSISLVASFVVVVGNLSVIISFVLVEKCSL